MSLSSPGFTVKAALDHASQVQIADVIGTRVVELLQAIDPSYADPAAQRNAAASIIDPFSISVNERLRRVVINSLPQSKAEELGRRIGIDTSGSIYSSLLNERSGILSSPKKRDGMLEFFGLDISEDRTSQLVSDSIASPGYALFEHQHRAAIDVARKLAAAPRKVLLHLPTGAGKTRTAMHIISRHLNSRENAVVCWLAQSQELLEQAADEFETCWQNLGSRPAKVVRFWKSGSLPETLPDYTLVVAGYAKLGSLLTRDPNAVLRLADANTLTVVDEAHQAIAPTYRDVIETLTTKRPGTPLLGLSATPGRTWSDVAADAQLSAFQAWSRRPPRRRR